MYTRKSIQQREYFDKDCHEFMYIVVLLIHPRKGLNVFTATSHSRIIHFFGQKS